MNQRSKEIENFVQLKVTIWAFITH